MSERKGAYVRPAKRLGVPGVIFAVVCRPRITLPADETRYETARWESAEIAVSYRRRSKWSAPKVQEVYTPEALRECMADWSAPERTNWVITPALSDTLTLTGWWDHAASRGIDFTRARDGASADGHDRDHTGRLSCDQFALFGGAEVVTYRDRGTKWRWVGERNYWAESVVAGAAPLGDRGAVGGAGATVGHTADGLPCPRARALLARYRGLCRWWGRVATAPLGTTASACGWGVLRSHVTPRTLCTHSDPDAHRLERCAAHGGRASVWFTREIQPAGAVRGGVADARCDRASPEARGPIERLDVVSMYPHILMSEQFPVRIGPRYGPMRPRDLIDLCEGVGVIARVRIHTTRGEYPMRTRSGTIYPTGAFNTHLCAPDIQMLDDDGAILDVYEVATYHMGRPFAAAMGVLLESRREAERIGDADAKALCKLVANSLAGRCAMRVGGWVRMSALDVPGKWGEEWIDSPSSASRIRMRYLCGACWVFDGEKVARGPHTSAFAYLTAYGRVMMRRIRDRCPARSVVSQCTDGLYVLAAASRSLSCADRSAHAVPGSLVSEGSADSGRWYGPRHYRWGDVWTLAGWHAPVVSGGHDRATYTTAASLFSAHPNRAPSEIFRKYISAPIPLSIECGVVQEDGWVRPPHIEQGRDETED